MRVSSSLSADVIIITHKHHLKQDEENGAQDVESEEDSGIQSKEELPRSPEKKRITPTPSPAKTKSNGGERLSAAAATAAAEEEEAERRTVRSSGDGGGRKKVGQSGQPLLCFVCFTFVCILCKSSYVCLQLQCVSRPWSLLNALSEPPQVS